MSPARLSSCSVLCQNILFHLQICPIIEARHHLTVNSLWLQATPKIVLETPAGWVHHAIWITASVLQVSCRQTISNYNFLSGVPLFLQSHSPELASMTDSWATDRIKSKVWRWHRWSHSRVTVTSFKACSMVSHKKTSQPPTDPRTHTHTHTHWSPVWCVWCNAGGGVGVSKHHCHVALKKHRAQKWEYSAGWVGGSLPPSKMS